MAKIIAEHELGETIAMVLNHAPAIQPIIGANCDGKPEFGGYYLGHIGNRGGHTLEVLRIPSNSYLNKGIKENLTASVNFPNAEMMDEAIYFGGGNSGPVTPSKVEKAKLKVFYGKLKTAPMIAKAPVIFECSVQWIMDCGSHQMVVVRIEYVHFDQECMPDGPGTMAKGWGGGPDSLKFLNRVNPVYRYHIFDTPQNKDVRSFLSIWTAPISPADKMAEISWVAKPPTPENIKRFESKANPETGKAVRKKAP